jgi:hypothetical protein
MTRRLEIFALIALAALPCAASAQAGRAPAGCTYETCALRVEPRDSAAANARRYVRAARTSNTLALLGAAAYVALLVHSNNTADDLDNTDIALGVTGLAFGIASIPFNLRAGQSLSRAVWFYNAALAR